MTIMRTEIEESTTVAARLIARRDELEAVGARLAARDPAVLVVAGRGTSDHAAIYARYLFEASLGIPVALAAASLQTQYGVTSASPRSALLALSQSGAGPDTIAVTEAARRAGALSIAITNDDASPLFAAAEIGVGLGAGPERAVAATKTYLAELVAVALIAAGAAKELQRQATWVDGLGELPDRMREALARTDAWIARSATHPAWRALLQADRALAVARGYDYPNALESALKLRETTGVFADGYSAADLLHGPIAAAGPATPAIVIATDPATAAGVERAAVRLDELGAPLLRLGGDLVPAAGEGLVLPVAAPGPLGTPIGGIALLALVEAVAVARGADPDAPAGLTKVTKTL
jgi:glucosamine--fructose-6-phosphate aminotransferase (isomerizing)